MDFKDYYKILGVDKKASAAEIKKVYRDLAKKHHPDANKGSDSDKKFKDISEAYTVLSDPEKRRKYDNLGSTWNRHRETGGTGDDFDWTEWMAKQQQARRTGNSAGEQFDSGGGISDFFDRVFGGFGRRNPFTQAQTQAPTAQKGKDAELEIEITLEEAYAGTTKLIGTSSEKMEVKFKPGTKDEQILKIPGKGNVASHGGAPGDLLIKVKVKPHAKYERKGDDLYIEAVVDLYTMILGGESHIDTLGGKVKITIPKESQSGKTLKLKGLGMPKYVNPATKGDLFVKLQVTLPANLTSKQKELFEQLRKG